MPDWWRGRREQSDPYADAAERMDRKRRAQDAGDLSLPVEGTPMPLPPRIGSRALLLLLALVVLLGVVRATRGSTTPDLATDCDRAGLALSGREVARGQVVRWSATGPPADRYVIAVDVAAFTAAGGDRYTPTPDAGKSVADTQTGSDRLSLGDDCRGSGYFGVRVPEGEHTVRLFRLGAASAEVVASKPLRVTAEH